MNKNFEKLFNLFESVTTDIIVDVVLDNSWQRKWSDKIIEKFKNMQEKGEKMLQEVPENSEFDVKINKILNDMDDLWREAQQKGLI